MLEGETLFELEGGPKRVIKAGETFWEPGGDVIHYQDGNNRTDTRSRFLVTMLRTGPADAHTGRRRRTGPAAGTYEFPAEALDRHWQPRLTGLSCGASPQCPG